MAVSVGYRTLLLGVFAWAAAAVGAPRKILPVTTPAEATGTPISCKIILAMSEDPMTLFAILAVPAYRGGRMIGFEVKTIDADAFPRELDLRAGDIVTHIENRPLTSVDSAREELWRFQKKPATVQATLLRNAKPRIQNYRCRW